MKFRPLVLSWVDSPLLSLGFVVWGLGLWVWGFRVPVEFRVWAFRGSGVRLKVRNLP